MRASWRPPGGFLAGVWDFLEASWGAPGASWGAPGGGVVEPPAGAPGVVRRALGCFLGGAASLPGAAWGAQEAFWEAPGGGYWLACLHARGGSVRLHDWQAQDARKWRRKRWRWLQLIPEHEIPLKYEGFWCSRRPQEAPGTLMEGPACGQKSVLKQYEITHFRCAWHKTKEDDLRSLKLA